MVEIIKVAAGAGTGKTSYLIDRVEEALKLGTKAEDICFTTFSKAGVLEAQKRAKEKFNLNRDELRNFTTIHSLCFRALGLSRDRVFGGKILGAFAKQLGLRLTWETDEGLYAATKDDRIINIINYKEVTNKALKDVWEKHKDLVPWFELLRVYEAMQEFKRKNKLVSYNDILIRVAEDPTIKLPSFKYLFIDEAQDCSTIQWNVLKNKLLGQVDYAYMVGDPDQAIFAWAGADVNEFIDFPVNKTILLEQSYRCPKLVQTIANRVVSKIVKRIDKECKPRSEKGHTQVVHHLYDINLNEGNWLLLGRNRSVLKKMEKDLRIKGYYYEIKDSSITTRAWKPSIEGSLFELIRKYWYFQEYRMSDKKSLLEVLENTELVKNIAKYKKELPEFITKENTPLDIMEYFKTYSWAEGIITYSFTSKSYIEALIKRGEKLGEIPRIRLSTIHSAKGAECNNVILSLDLSASSYEALQNKDSRDEELRCLYVGITRAKESLYLLYPSTDRNYLDQLRK